MHPPYLILEWEPFGYLRKQVQYSQTNDLSRSTPLYTTPVVLSEHFSEQTSLHNMLTNNCLCLTVFAIQPSPVCVGLQSLMHALVGSGD